MTPEGVAVPWKTALCPTLGGSSLHGGRGETPGCPNQILGAVDNLRHGTAGDRLLQFCRGRSIPPLSGPAVSKMKTKRCSDCELEKPIGEFDPTRRDPEKIKGMCRDCCSKERERVLEVNRQQRAIKAVGCDYASRNANLNRLGFDTYPDYLRSDLWRAVRVKVYAAKGRDCYLCGKPATELHHNRYHANDLTGETIRFINPICRQCHESIEFRDGKKVTLHKAAKSFRKKLRNRERDRLRKGS